MAVWIDVDDASGPSSYGPIGYDYLGTLAPNIPGDGWIVGLRIMCVGSTGDTVRLGLHDSQGLRLFQGSARQVPTNTFGFPAANWLADTTPVVKVNTGQQVYVGGYRNDTTGIFFFDNIGSKTDGSGTNTRVDVSTGGTVPLDLIPPDYNFATRLYVGYLFESNLMPTRPSWISPTPANNGSVANINPTMRFTLPHPEAADDTKEIHVELYLNGVLWRNLFVNTNMATHNANGYYDHSEVGLAPGDVISVRARHRDLFDQWSDYSDTRVFTITDAAPGQGTWSSPTPAEGVLVQNSTPPVKGTTPHPGADAAYDYTTEVQIQVVNATTNAVLQDVIFAPTVADRNADVFNYTLAAIGQGTNVKIRFRHHDRKGTWSLWSAYRTFSISAGPDPPNVTRPAGKVNYRNQTEYQAQGGVGDLYSGSYNNVSGTIMHSVRVQIANADGTATLYDSGWVARTATAGVWTLPQASFAGHPTALSWGTSYKVRANVAESNAGVRGIESGWGAYTDFRTNSFPDRPGALSPADGIPSATGQFSADVIDPDGDQITAAAMTLKRTDNNVTVAPPAMVIRTTYALGAEVTRAGDTLRRAYATNAGRTPDTLPTLSSAMPNEGNTYKHMPAGAAIGRNSPFLVGACHLRPGQTTADTWWMECTTAGTTHATVVPTGYNTPVDGATVTDGTAVFTFRKPITWLNAGPADEWSMVVSGTALSRTFDTSLLTLGVEYQWFCRARDATGWGQTSFVEPFVYASIPEVTMLAPQAAERVNLVRDPSAEYDPGATPYWTVVGGDVDNTIERSDEASLYGDYAWKGTTTATNDLMLRGEIHTIDFTRPYLLQAEFKKLSGTANTRFRIRCLQADGTTFISNVIPTSILTLNGVNVPTTWTRYGGIIWPNGSGNSPAWPALTNKVQIEILPSDDSLASVYFDGVAFEQLPATVWTTGQWAEVQKWHAYFDGDMRSHTSRTKEYYWQGNIGQSASQGDPRLSSAASKVYYRFNHNSNMEAKRLLVDHWSDAKNAWVQIHDAGFSAEVLAPAAIGAIDMPPSVIRNDDRYRFRVQARDTLGLSGEGAGTLADTDYIGQPEPLITSISADVGKAEISVSWEQSGLADANFGGYEIARALREDDAGTYVSLHIERNKAVTTFTDPYPLSGVNYIYMVRIIQIIGVDEQQGRWGKAPMNIDYFPYSFVKDLEDPFNLYVAYETPFEAMPTPDEDAHSQMMQFWGRKKPTIVTRADMRLRSGSVTANFYQDAAVVEPAMTRFERMVEILDRRKGIVLLLQEPIKRRLFASVIGSWRPTYRGVEQRGVEFDYHENSYEEDLRDREDTL